MATPAQIAANRKNAQLSTGPRRTERTRFNGLKHGLRAEQVVLPGEDPAAFEAEKQAWLDDWRPCTHTRAVLVERAAVASWKLRRASRVEAVWLHERAADAAHEFELQQKERVENSLHTLSWDTAASLARLEGEAAGLDRLVGLWEGLAGAASAPGGWTSRQDHHDRLLHLLGHPSGSEPKGLEIAGVSLKLLGADDPAAAAGLRAFCLARIAELRAERAKFWDPADLRRRMIDLAIAPTSKEAQLLHRYEMAHEKALYAAIRGLQALERSGADLPEQPEDEPVAAGWPGQSLRAPDGGAEVVPSGARGLSPGHPGPSPESEAADGSITTHFQQSSCGKLASVGAAAPRGARPGRPAGSPGRPRRRNRPVGADPGPKKAPKRA